MGGGSIVKDHHQPTPPSSYCLTRSLITKLVYILLPLAVIHIYFFPRPAHSPLPFSAPPLPIHNHRHHRQQQPQQEPPHVKRARCDYGKGRWVPLPPGAAGPLYNGTSCGTIKDGQNCMAHGRPDTGYLGWRWQPSGAGCGSLPPFDAASFLRLLRHRHLAFVGDSMARNQVESLLCLLSTTSSPPILVYRDGEDNKFRRWRFPDHNATVSVFWSPFLVRGVEKSAAAGLDHNELHLDAVDERWAAELGGIDTVVLSVGHWFLHPAVYLEKGGSEVIGCHYCPGLNHTEVGFYDVYGRAFRTALGAVTARWGGGATVEGGRKKKHAVVTTFSPAHFEGEWDKAGACPKTEPYGEGERKLEGMDLEMRRKQVAEVDAAARVWVEALDVTELALMRPDGHPGPYMYAEPFKDGVPERVQNDCVHWCLPGPIDAWNEILLQMMVRRREEEEEEEEENATTAR